MKSDASDAITAGGRHRRYALSHLVDEFLRAFACKPLLTPVTPPPRT